MHTDTGDGVSIVELDKIEASSIRLHYEYTSEDYYDLSIHHEPGGWKIELNLKPFEKPFEKTFESRFFEEFVEEPRVFAAVLNGEQVGWLEIGYHKWNNRMRIWEILIKQGFRRQGIGTALMNHAVKIAREKGARALALETQSCNAPAISFYLKYGFELVGFDATAYTNQDMNRKEVRLEMGMKM